MAKEKTAAEIAASVSMPKRMLELREILGQSAANRDAMLSRLREINAITAAFSSMQPGADDSATKQLVAGLQGAEVRLAAADRIFSFAKAEGLTAETDPERYADLEKGVVTLRDEVNRWRQKLHDGIATQAKLSQREIGTLSNEDLAWLSDLTQRLSVDALSALGKAANEAEDSFKKATKHRAKLRALPETTRDEMVQADAAFTDAQQRSVRAADEHRRSMEFRHSALHIGKMEKPLVAYLKLRVDYAEWQRTFYKEELDRLNLKHAAAVGEALSAWRAKVSEKTRSAVAGLRAAIEVENEYRDALREFDPTLREVSTQFLASIERAAAWQFGGEEASR